MMYRTRESLHGLSEFSIKGFVGEWMRQHFRKPNAYILLIYLQSHRRCSQKKYSTWAYTVGGGSRDSNESPKILQEIVNLGMLNHKYIVRVCVDIDLGWETFLPERDSTSTCGWNPPVANPAYAPVQNKRNYRHWCIDIDIFVNSLFNKQSSFNIGIIKFSQLINIM